MIGLEDIISKYGTSLSQTRKMMREFVPALGEERKRLREERRRELYPFLYAPQLYTREDAKSEFGVDLEEGWRLKLYPDESEQGYGISYISPDRWEVFPDDTYLSPQGKKYTQAQLEAEETATRKAAIEAWLQRLVTDKLIPNMDVARALWEVGGEENVLGHIEDVQARIAAQEEIPEAIAPPAPAEMQPATDDFTLAISRLYDFQTPDSIADWAKADPEGFLENILTKGRTPDTETILRGFSLTDEDIDALFAEAVPSEVAAPIPPEGISYTLETYGKYKRELHGLEIIKTDVLIKPDYSVWYQGEQIGNINPETGELEPRKLSKEELDRGEIPTRDIVIQAGENLGKAWKAVVSDELIEFPVYVSRVGGVALGALGVAGAWLEKYVGRPWEMAILEARARVQKTYGADRQIDRLTMERLAEARDKYGWAGALISEDVSDIWHAYKEKTGGAVGTLLAVDEWLNPAYLVPIGGTFGLAARFTSKIPLLGKALKYTAAGVQATEKGMVYPITKPIALGAKSAQKAGAALGDKMASRLIRQTEHLELLMDIPVNEKILNGVLVDNWMKKALTIAAKVPPVRTGIEKGLGWRAIIKRESQVLEDIVARGAVIKSEIMRRGINAKAVKLWELRAIESNPVKLFGFNEKAYSPKMVERLLPEHKGLAEAGTLEHVFIHPEMYNWEGMRSGLEYVTRLHEINVEMLNLLKKEGVPPKRIMEEWIHRDVLGIESEAGELIAARRAADYMKVRRAKTMAEGIAWGVRYNRNPEAAITTYIERAYKHIADARFDKYIEEFASEYWTKPTQRMLQQHPELFEKVVLPKGEAIPKGYVQARDGGVFKPISLLKQEELADAAKFQGVINRALRGEKTSTQTLNAIERRFPELGRKLRSLVEERGIADKQLRDILKQNEATIKTLSGRLRIKAIQETLGRSPKLAIPDDVKLYDAFKVMSYEDRLAFRSTMNSQLDDIGEVVGDHLAEIEGIKEFLASDAVASYRGHIGKRYVSLAAILKHGKFPETLTQKEAQILLMGRELKPNALTAEGRVKWEYITDEMAEHFGMTEREFINHLESVAAQKVRVDDLELLVKLVQDREKGVNRMLKVLDDVDTNPRFIPEIEPELIPKAVEGIPEVKIVEPIKPSIEGGALTKGGDEVFSVKHVSLGHTAFGASVEKLKRGNLVAVEQMLNKELTPEKLNQIRHYIGMPEVAVYIPVPPPPGGGNRLPSLFADTLSKKIGGKAEEGIASLPEKIGKRCLMMNGWEKLATRRNFEAKPGMLASDRNVFIIDDVFTDGGTIRDLSVALQKAGYNVKGYITLGTSRKYITKGNRIKAIQETFDAVAKRFGDDGIKQIETAMGYSLRDMTEGELRVLLQAKDIGAFNTKFNAAKALYASRAEALIPKAAPGMPEAGYQAGMLGGGKQFIPKGKGEITQISMDEYGKLAKMRKDAGLPPPDVAIKPKIEGIKGLEAETTINKVSSEIPVLKSTAERKAELTALRNEVKDIVESRKMPYWRARSEHAFRMEQARQPGIGEGYIMQPFAGGKIYDREFIDAFNKFFGHEAGLPGLNVISDVAGILRITKAALDFSAMAIQGLPAWGLAHTYMLQNPKIGVQLMGSWYKGLFLSTKAFFTPDTIAQYMGKNKAIAMQRVSFGGSVRAVDYFAALEAQKGLGGLAQKAMGKIPFKPYHRAETSFFGAGEIVRDEFWKILSPKAIKNGQEFELARFLDRITGITDPKAIGVPLSVRQLEQSFMWFAPSYTRACLTVLSDIFRGGMVGAEARKAIGGMIAAGSAMYTGVQYSIASLEGKSEEDAWNTVKEGFCIYEDPITGEVEWRPSGRFMTLKIGNYSMGFGGFWYGLLRLAGNIAACADEVGEREKIDLVRIMKNGSLNKKDNPFIYWWYCRSSPFFGAGFELLEGKDFLGYPIETPTEYAKYIATRFEPIWAEQGLNWMIPGMARDNEIPEGLAREALIPAEIFGLRTFPESSWVQFYDEVNKRANSIPKEELDPKQLEAWQAGKLGWKHLTDIQRMDLLSRYSELNKLYEESMADSAVRGSDNWKQWKGRTGEEKATYYSRADILIGRVESGELDTRELREMWSDAGQNYGVALDMIEKEPAYEAIYNLFDRKEAEGDKYGFRDDLALSEYTKIMFADYLDENGDVDWDGKDRAVDAYIEKWGDDTYERIRQMYADKKNLAGLPEALINLSDDKEKLGRGYWRLPYKPFTDMDEEDEAEGNIPAEYHALWKEYQGLETDDKRDAFEQAHPEFAKDWRAEYRLNNPEDDARLALWGYGGKLQSMEAYDLVVKWGRELGIPLTQMGLGLPPYSLADDYFTYNKIASTREKKWFRQEHPRFEAWGQEAYGWKSIEEQEVTPRNVAGLYDEYNKLPTTGKDRLIFRHENSELEKWLVDKGYTPVGERWKEED